MRSPIHRSNPGGTPASSGGRWRPWFALAVPVLLTSCGGDGYDNYGGCGNCFAGPPTEFSYGVVSGDFSGSHLTDIVQFSTVHPEVLPSSSNLKLFPETGAGAYGNPTSTAAGDDPLYAVSTDLNGDGYPDVVTASFEDAALYVFFNNKLAPGTFNSPLVLPSPGASQVAFGDLNGDGLTDLVSADFNVSLFVQTSPGTFAAPVYLYPGGANWVAVGDLNGDGAADVALTDDVGVKVLMHTGPATSTTFAAPVSVFTQTLNDNVIGANIIAIGDVDGDLLNDLVITDPGPTGGMTPTVNVLRQDPANHGSFLAADSYPIAAQDLPQSILLVDLQGSGKLDIVIGGLNTVTVLLHDPANPGKFLPASMYTAPGANEIAVGDVNGDGKLDIIVANGVTQPVVNGVVTTHPGVLLQGATAGTFGTVQDLP